MGDPLGPLGFFNIHSVAKLRKKRMGTLWWKKFEKMSHNAEKKRNPV